MTLPVLTASGQAASLNRPIPGMGGEPDGAEVTDSTGFSQCFNELVARQMSRNGHASLVEAGNMSDTDADTPATTENLATLLPFMDALGLTQGALKLGETIEATTTAKLAAETALDATSTLAMPAIPAAVLSTTMVNPDASTAAGLDSSPTALTSGLTTSSSLTTSLDGTSPARAGATSDTGSLETGLLTRLTESIGTEGNNGSPIQLASDFSQQIASLTTNSNRASQPVSSSHSIATPVGTTGWSEEVGNRVVWMAGAHESRAELVLTPPDMGRVEISLSIKGEQASASFVSANPIVRDALEAALPQLRETLAQAGIQLGQTQVGAENPQSSGQQTKNGQYSASNPAGGQGLDGSTFPVESAALPVLKSGRGMVDVFA